MAEYSNDNVSYSKRKKFLLDASSSVDSGESGWHVAIAGNHGNVQMPPKKITIYRFKYAKNSAEMVPATHVCNQAETGVASGGATQLPTVVLMQHFRLTSQ